MNFLVIGGNCRNKGAHLMLHAASYELQQRFPDSTILTSVTAGPAVVMRSMGYHSLNVPLPHLGSRFYRPFAPVLLRLSRSLPGHGIGDVHAVLDISGFAFGDQFGAWPVANLRWFTRKNARNGRRCVLLPQSFGPFKRTATREAMREVIANVDLACARDPVSLSCLQEIVNSDKLNLYPDLTLGLEPVREKCDVKLSRYCCIVPSVRMLDAAKSSLQWEREYATIMTRIIERLRGKHKLDVLLLVHDSGGGDMAVARDLAQRLHIQNVYTHPNPLVLKAAIGDSVLVVGSRFHALASAFSCGVPAVALGWSHKYKEFFAEYGQEDCVFADPEDVDVDLVDALLDVDEHERRHQQISHITRLQKEKICSLWDTVARLISPPVEA